MYTWEKDKYYGTTEISTLEQETYRQPEPLGPKLSKRTGFAFFPRGPRGTSNWISGKRVAPLCSLQWEYEYRSLAALCLGEIGELISLKKRPIKLPEWNWNITYTYKVFWIYCHSETLIYTQYLDATFPCYTFNIPALLCWWLNSGIPINNYQMDIKKMDFSLYLLVYWN